ncbi:flagellar motor switch protein FliG [Candidatus Poribacteria bacterium]|nr:flagellar motor switch protein FliG [Candidatus Poribacteria bacterium]
MQNELMDRNTAPDHEEHTGAEKAAIMLITLGQQNAAMILPNLNQPEIENITLNIGRFHVVSNKIRLKVLQEFRMMMLAKEYISQGGLDYARALLSMVMNKSKAGELIERIRRNIEGNPFAFMEDADPQNLLETLQQEHPQTIALILAHLSPHRASSVIQGLTPDTRLDVVKRIASMDQIDPEIVSLIHDSLRGKISSILTSQDRFGGTKQVADILNLVDGSSERQIIFGLAADDPELAEEIQSKMFTFDDLEHMDDREMQKLLVTIDNADLILALRGATDSLKEKFLNCVSSRNREAIIEELETMGRTLLKDVEGAQTNIAERAKNLEAAGEIIIIRGTGDEAQYI